VKVRFNVFGISSKLPRKAFSLRFQLDKPGVTHLEHGVSSDNECRWEGGEHVVLG